MASHYSANQYDDAFRARRLQQYEVPKQYKQHPATRTGNTKIVASDVGHLLPGVPRSEESPWGDFKGTWDLPNRIPGNHLSNPCARRADQAPHLSNPCARGADQAPHVSSGLPISADRCRKSPEACGGAAEACGEDCGSGRKAGQPLSPSSPEPRNRDPRLPTPLEKETVEAS